MKSAGFGGAWTCLAVPGRWAHVGRRPPGQASARDRPEKMAMPRSTSASGTSSASADM